MSVIALVPAHNESANIASAIWRLMDQTNAPHRIIVIADNCTDDTVEIASSMNAEVFETVNNQHKKASCDNSFVAKWKMLGAFIVLYSISVILLLILIYN